jgi:DNA invertase Pin-like site-specific DNA recombinase
MGRLIITVMAAVAEMERDLIRERTLAGLEAARRQGRVGGKKPMVTDDQVRSAAKRILRGEGGAAVAKDLGISRQALYKRMKELREREEAEEDSDN